MRLGGRLGERGILGGSIKFLIVEKGWNILRDSIIKVR